MAAQRTTIRLGSISIEVGLVKTSSEPKAAKWDTKTVGADSPGVDLAADFEMAVAGAPIAAGEEVALGGNGTVVPADDPLGDRADQAAALISGANGGLVGGAPETKVLRGVYAGDDEFIDLTDRLAAIDEDCKIDGMEIVAAIGSPTIPRERVRGSSFVQPADPVAKRACAMLFDALAQGQRALAVRWTKRTNQALGIIVASKTHECLLLLEVEFAANMKAPPEKALVGKLALSLTDEERAAADRFIGALGGRRSDLDAIGDERRERHAALLTAAREGQLDQYDAEHPVPVDVIEEFEAEFADVVGATA